ncbi:O-antigen ligase [Aquipseudomonas alcaligenes]|uniref:O-antigen ligase family protein n=1 Tax=Aquipseudomonas alcaligenes TaxID=43263 RepID=UPI00223C4DC8|nr:O-antigen ligase family protein [Pseudomonas alcaligenes]
MFTQLAGLVFNNDSSRYATQLYLLLFVPALVLLLGQPTAGGLWRQPPALILLALFVWVLLQAGFNPGSQKGLGQWGKILLLQLLYLSGVACLVRREQLFHGVAMAAVAVVALFAWATLYYQYGVLEHPLSYPEVRLFRLRELGWHGFADLDHPIVAGLYYAVFAVVLCWLFVSRQLRFWQGALMALGMLGLLLYVLFTFSRGAWFSLAGSLFVLLLFTPNPKARSLLGLGVLALGLILLLFWPEIQAERSVGLSNRDQIWANWQAHLPEFWLWGSGAGAELFYRFSEAYRVIHAHSLYLQLWFELGIVGIALFVALLLSLLWKAWTCRQQPLARLGGALLVFAMIAMVTDIYAIFQRPSPYWVVFWFPVGILLGLRRDEAAASA